MEHLSRRRQVLKKSSAHYLVCFSILLTFCGPVLAESPKLKYGDRALPLSRTHSYFQKHAAPRFWTLIPYYVHQQDESACSVASVAMVLNAARAKSKLTTEDPLVTQTDLVSKVNNSVWKKSGLMTQGVTLDQLKSVFEDAFKVYGIKTAQIEVVHAEDSPETKKKLHEALVQSEKTSREFIVANFLQGIYTDDGEYGHIAPLGAYDEENKRALILDPDRKWYEPYWVSEEILLKGMATLDKQSGQKRGYLWIKLP
jgi:hypothetical protein